MTGVRYFSDKLKQRTASVYVSRTEEGLMTMIG